MAKPISTDGLGINGNPPLMMHVDMNSCFATIEQQANHLLRGKPIAVSPYTTPRGIIIAPSIEAKKIGIKLGMTNAEAKLIYPDIVILPPDPPKYRDAHMRFKRIFMSYTDKVLPKSIDEAVIDFERSQIINHRSLEDIGMEIKKRVHDEIGDWVRVNVGIGNNPFIAKLAAGLNKPDGLDKIDAENLLEVYRTLDLVDLPGINVRYEARLNSAGIFSPLQFFAADLQTLKKRVFQSINGYYWYLRLRGWPIDDISFSRKTIGHTYALGIKTANKEQIGTLLMKLCMKVGKRLRQNDLHAGGIHVAVVYHDGTHWHRSKRVHAPIYTDMEIYRHGFRTLNMQPQWKVVTHLAVSVFNLDSHSPLQQSIFDGARADPNATAVAIDIINERYGDFMITPAILATDMMKETIKDRISFGGVRDIQNMYADGE